MDAARTGSFGKLAPGAPGDPVEFGPYLLFGMIARGGMAEVYRARARSGPAAGQGLLAIKVMRPQLAKETRFVEMFIREGKLAMMLTDDAIVRTIDVGEVDGRYFIAMEYIGGKDLTQVLRRCQESNQRIPVPHAIFIAARISEGLHSAHTLTDPPNDPAGRPLTIVNRDVSPSNVRLAYDGRVKLLDFGIAQAMLKFTSEIGILKGKFSYMSPEQIRGLPVDARTDVFSTGIILHEMLTTEKLFRGDTEFALMEKVRNAEVGAPSKFNRRVNPELDRICLKALARDLPERYQSAREFRDDLLALLASYKFRPQEMEEFMRGLFRQDVARELEEQKSCELGPPRELDLDPSSDQSDDLSDAVMEIEASGVDVPAPLPAFAPAPSPAPPPGTAVTVRMNAVNPPPSQAESERAPAPGPSPAGFWARMKNKLSK